MNIRIAGTRLLCEAMMTWFGYIYKYMNIRIAGTRLLCEAMMIWFGYIYIYLDGYKQPPVFAGKIFAGKSHGFRSIFPLNQSIEV